MKRLVACVVLLSAVASCDPAWRYRVRRPSGDPLSPADDGFEVVSLAGGRVDYGIRASWVAMTGVVETRIRNRGAGPLRVRVDRARFVIGSGLAIAPSSAADSRGERAIVMTTSGPTSVDGGTDEPRRPAPAERIEVAPGSELRIRRTFGPMSPYRGCAAEPDLALVLFVDDGLELGDEEVEARFTLRRG